VDKECVRKKLYNMNMRKGSRFLTIFTIVYIIFLSLFSFDSLEVSIWAFLIHMIPSFLLLIALVISLKNAKLGGGIFLSLSIVATFFFSTTLNAIAFLIITVPLLLIGIAYISLATKGVKQLLVPVVSVLFLTTLFVFVISLFSIGNDVRNTCKGAMKFHEGDCVTALSLYLDSEISTLAERKRAVWTLGQLGDGRALPVLNKYLTGEACDHETMLCQYELEKAIKWCSTNENILSPIWQRLFL